MKKNLHRAQTMQLSFGPTLCPFAFLQLLVMVVEVGVDLGMVLVGVGKVVVVGRRNLEGREVAALSTGLMLV